MPLEIRERQEIIAAFNNYRLQNFYKVAPITKKNLNI